MFTVLIKSVLIELKNKGDTMNHTKWKVILILHIFMLYKSVETCQLSPSFITMQGHKYFHICNLWGKFLPVGMICTTTNTISIPVGEMYWHAKMFCALSHMPNSHGAINFYMQELFYTRWYHFYAHVCDVFTCKNVLYTYSTPYIFHSHGCSVRAWNLFWASVAKPVLWQLMILLPCTLPQTSSIIMSAINFYLQDRFLHSLISLLFPCS